MGSVSASDAAGLPGHKAWIIEGMGRRNANQPANVVTNHPGEGRHQLGDLTDGLPQISIEMRTETSRNNGVTRVVLAVASTVWSGVRNNGEGHGCGG